MKPRIRIVGFQVQPQVMADDGENLASVNVSPVFVPAAQWETWAHGAKHRIIEQVGAQVNNAAASPPAAEHPHEEGAPQ